MLRTHGELGYKQEQRFHLELGLLKMAHAQKLLPIEQLLSDVAAAPTTAAQRPPARPSIVGSAPNSETRRSDPAQAPRQNFVSPFAADSARKGTPRQESSSDPAPPTGPRMVAAASAPEPVIMGSAAPDPIRRDVASNPSTTSMQLLPDTLQDAPDTVPRVPDTIRRVPDTIGKGMSSTRATGDAEERALEPEGPPAPEPKPPASENSNIERLQSAVLQALTDGNQRILVSMLSAGEWSVQGNELIIKIAESQTVVDMSLGPDAKRLAIASASGVLGRPVRLKVVPSATVAPRENKPNGGPPRPSGPGGRGRAEQDPVVRRMQEKFSAEIRTVIDYKEKR
jgi:DNA polymerase-3 subunit gamma/tau